jgi:hypothetical protein
MRSNRIIFAVAALLAPAAEAMAAPPGETAVVEQAPEHWSGVGLALDLGWTTGIATGVQVQRDRLGARITAGWNPVIVSTKDADMEVDLHGFHAAQLNADVFVQAIDVRPGVRLALVGGYRYNTLLGHGVNFAVDAQVRRTRNFSWHVLGGVAVFPDGEARIERTKGLSDVGFGAGIQTGLAFGVTALP